AADRVLLAAHPALDAYVSEAYLAVIEAIVRERNPAVAIFAYSTIGLDLGPALAVRTGRSLIAYCKALSVKGDALEAESQLYGGKVDGLASAKLPAVVAVMPGAFPEAEVSDGSGLEAVEIVPPQALSQPRIVFVSESAPAADAFDITRAEKIVCVGRGVKDKSGVEAVRELAEALGAEIGGSRPVIDEGLLPKERQIGKSGFKVKPKLYLALGVSGAPEHLEGMRRAGLIVAINTDPKAPIFGVAHCGATCDLLDVAESLKDMLN
ncbi:MAG: electron transfer flavoprotein subunit alpha/FixB family protein, partial [Bradyrhizobium sp.]